MVPRFLSSLRDRIEVLERKARARFLRWLASGAVIEERDGAGLGEGELAALSEAIARARRHGR